MALLHHAELVPSKLELVAGWITARPFWPAGAEPGALSRLAAFRFDDPAGRVGIESLLLAVGESTLQVPLTYRDAPLGGAEPALIGTMEHSVLGTRWVYDATGDPVYLAELVRVVLTGGREAALYYEEEGRRVARPGDARVCGSGHPGAALPTLPTDAAAIERRDEGTTTVVRAGTAEVLVMRAVGSALPADRCGETLAGDWRGVSGALLAVVRHIA